MILLGCTCLAGLVLVAPSRYQISNTYNMKLPSIIYFNSNDRSVVCADMRTSVLLVEKCDPSVLTGQSSLPCNSSVDREAVKNLVKRKVSRIVQDHRLDFEVHGLASIRRNIYHLTR